MSSSSGRGAGVQEIPEELAYLLRTKVLAHVSLTEADGSLVTTSCGWTTTASTS